MARVLVSAGHTQMDPGAIFGELRETDLTRNIARRIIPYLQDAGVEARPVPLDLPLLQRIAWINDTGFTDEAGDICVEIHINDGGRQGLEAWYRGNGGNNSQRLAESLLSETANITGYASLGSRSEFEHELGSLTFLNRSNPATVILETLFIDHPEDALELRDEEKLELLAEAVASSIIKYLDEPDRAMTSTQANNQNAASRRRARPMPSNPPNFPMPSPMPPQPATPPARNMMLDREERRKVIESSYHNLLGRKPAQQELNYFLNTGISESDLLKKIAASQEHLDLIKAKREAKEFRDENAKLTKSIASLNSELSDQKAITENLQRVLAIRNRQQIQAGNLHPTASQAGPGASQSAALTNTAKTKRTLTERVYDTLSSR